MQILKEKVFVSTLHCIAIPLRPIMCNKTIQFLQLTKIKSTVHGFQCTGNFKLAMRMHKTLAGPLDWYLLCLHFVFDFKRTHGTHGQKTHSFPCCFLFLFLLLLLFFFCRHKVTVMAKWLTFTPKVNPRKTSFILVYLMVLTKLTNAS